MIRGMPKRKLNPGVPGTHATSHPNYCPCPKPAHFAELPAGTVDLPRYSRGARAETFSALPVGSFFIGSQFDVALKLKVNGERALCFWPTPYCSAPVEVRRRSADSPVLRCRVALHYRAVQRPASANGMIDPFCRTYSYCVSARVPFSELPDFAPYDSQSRWGLCLKLSTTEAFSLSRAALVEGLSPGWECVPLRAKIRWRVAK